LGEDVSADSLPRKLAAVVYADVAGYSRLTGEDEEGTHRRLSRYLDIISESVAANGGRVVHYAGDAVLADFSTVSEALKSAVTVQETLGEENADLPEERRILFRFGVNLGEVIVDRDDIYGDGVNVAARLEGLASPGGICISEAVRTAIGKKLPLEYEFMGEQQVKNIAAPIRAYRIIVDSETPHATQWTDGTSLTLPSKPSIAVLPFTNMSPDPEQEFFADGVTEDIITALSNVQSFFVIARNSSFTFKGQAVDVKDVGRDLGVRYVMEGSVRRAGNRVRITAQLLDATTGNNVWADRFDRALEDIFELQDEVTENVVGAIEPHLNRAEFERIRGKRPESLDAYDFTLRGLSLMNNLTPGDTTDALELFRKAIDSDSRYARAYVCASWCYRRHVQIRGMTLPEEDKAESIHLAEVALRLDSTDPYVLWQAGMTAGLVGADIEKMNTLIERSLAINANSTRAWSASGILHCILGEPGRAIADAERAIRLSPLDTSMWVAFGILANAHMQLQQHEEAASWARKSVSQHKFNLPAYHALAASCTHLGHQAEAEKAVSQLRELDPELTITRIQQIYPVARYQNLNVFLEGLRQAGLPQ
jgi:TolB-like protein/class 3 adenylate cyclase